MKWSEYIFENIYPKIFGWIFVAQKKEWRKYIFFEFLPLFFFVFFQSTFCLFYGQANTSPRLQKYDWFRWGFYQRISQNTALPKIIMSVLWYKNVTFYMYIYFLLYSKIWNMWANIRNIPLLLCLSFDIVSYHW